MNVSIEIRPCAGCGQAPTSGPDLSVADLAIMLGEVGQTSDGWLAAFQNRVMSRSARIGETLPDRIALAARIRAALPHTGERA